MEIKIIEKNFKNSRTTGCINSFEHNIMTHLRSINEWFMLGFWRLIEPVKIIKTKILQN